MYPAIYVGCKDSSEELRSATCPGIVAVKYFVGKVLNYKEIILSNLAEYRLILGNSAHGLVG